MAIDEPARFALQLGNCRRRFLGVAPGDHDRGAGLDQTVRDAEANAAVPASNDRHSSRQIEQSAHQDSPGSARSAWPSSLIRCCLVLML